MSVAGTVQENRKHLPNDVKKKVAVVVNGQVKKVANPILAKDVFCRGALYFRHTADEKLSLAVWRDNRVSINVY